MCESEGTEKESSEVKRAAKSRLVKQEDHKVEKQTKQLRRTCRALASAARAIAAGRDRRRDEEESCAITEGRSRAPALATAHARIGLRSCALKTRAKFRA